MSLATLIAILAALLVVALAAQVLTLKLSCKLWKIKTATWRRATVVVLISIVINVAISVGGALLRAADPNPQGFGLSVVQLALSVVAVCLTICAVIKTTAGRAFAVWLTSALLNAVVVVALFVPTTAYLVEPFVIPTGAMAPAVYGTHSPVQCDNCGFEYAVSMSHRNLEVVALPVELESTCFNCGNRSIIPTDAAAYDGDRVLVDKTSRPQRWQQAVFKHPSDRASTYHMRAVGLPGETLKIAGGDIFVDGERLQKPPLQHPDLWFFVHDSKFVPKEDAVDDPPGWEPAQEDSTWQLQPAGQWYCVAKENAPDELRFTRQVRDRVDYNSASFVRDNLGPDLVRETRPVVPDLKVTLTIATFAGRGQLRVIREFNGTRISAIVQPDGQVNISVKATDQEGGTVTSTVVVEDLAASLAQGAALEFAYRDGLAYVLVGNRAVTSLAIAPADAGREAADVASSLSLIAENCEIEIDRIQIKRDVYYLTPGEVPGLRGAGPSSSIIQLGDDEYYMLGDNSRMSKDSRVWGPVKAELMVGVARWLYWPLSRRRQFD